MQRQSLHQVQSKTASLPSCLTSDSCVRVPKAQKPRIPVQKVQMRSRLPNLSQELAWDLAQRQSSPEPSSIRSMAASGMQGARQPLPHLEHIQSAFGKIEVSNISAHTGSAATAANRALGSEAYASGNQIAFCQANPSLQTTAHEVAHIVQQRLGVDLQAGIGQAGDRYEQQADAIANLVVQGKPVEHLFPSASTDHQTALPAIQFKSYFKNINNKKDNAETPIAALSKHFKPYYQAVALPEQYYFHHLTKQPSDPLYSGTFARAGEVEARIESASHLKADGKDRNNDVIQPYGHFGIMERAIFGRPNTGTTYDGGHLIEHTLMEGKDADVHGNLAPQEGIYFNQRLMRAWESVPETYADRGENFDYSVKLNYSAETYDRTGDQLLAANVLDSNLATRLAATPAMLQKLKNEKVTFERWIPDTWFAKLSNPDSGSFSVLILNRGTNWSNVQATVQDAEKSVVDTSKQSPNTGKNLKRQLSGTLSGFVETAAAALGGNGQLTVGGQPSLSALFYQPEPQDRVDQDAATSNPGGMVPVALPQTTATVNLLPKEVDVGEIANTVDKMELEKPMKTKTRSKTNSELDKELTQTSPHYKALREVFFKNADESGELIKVFKVVVADLKSKLSPLSRLVFTRTHYVDLINQAAKKSIFAKKSPRMRLLRSALDNNLTDPLLKRRKEDFLKQQKAQAKRNMFFANQKIRKAKQYLRSRQLNNT